MESLKELTEHGKSLGLEDEALHDFIKTQQTIQRDERVEQRKKEQEEHEYQLELVKLQIEKQKLEEKTEITKRESDFNLRIKELEYAHQMTIAKMEADIKGKVVISPTNAKVPKIPPYEESKDDIDSYLRRFERYAKAMSWEKQTWATNLSALLKGRALSVYALLPADKALDYDALKSALLKRFELTEDGFRKKFRDCRPENGETFQQFSVRMGSYLDRWLEMAKIPHTFDGLYDIVIRDQFMSVCNRDLLLFLKERIPDSMANMSALADQYREARLVSAVSLMTNSKKVSGFHDKGKSVETPSSLHSQPNKSKTSEVVSHGRGDKRCYKCDKLGHIASECRPNRSRPTTTAVVSSGQSSNEVEYGACGACSLHTNTPTYSVSSTHKLMSTSCNTKVRCSSVAMPTAKGLIGDREVMVLRDTGCNGVVIKKELVSDHQFTGKTQVCILANGSTVNTPMALVNIDTPFFTGKVEAWCLVNPLYDIIIGNIENARQPYDPDSNWTLPQIQPVQTRSQVRTESKKCVPLKVRNVIGTDVSPQELKQAQDDDEILSKIRSLLNSSTITEGKASFYCNKGLIYRRFQSDKVDQGREFKQLVVPKRYRVKVMQLAHDSLLSGHLGTERTLKKVLSEFFWPGIQADVRRFCRSCDRGHVGLLISMSVGYVEH